MAEKRLKNKDSGLIGSSGYISSLLSNKIIAFKKSKNISSIAERASRHILFMFYRFKN